MPVIVASIFSAFIVYYTAYSIVKVLGIAYGRKEISLRRYVTAGLLSFIIGVAVSSLLPFGYQKVFDLIS
ncbi:hypothetical protein [Bacillus sp. EB01]|uniref:hypothetical protein n=1 Tax=Bacillus sp. EB01 TaxID=1347086 RepID=UPI0005C736F4|nr:hypothetical protein [Bacillus sp. EB01]